MSGLEHSSSAILETGNKRKWTMYQETTVSAGSMSEFVGSDMNLNRKRQELESKGYGRKVWTLTRVIKPECKVKGQR